MAVWFACERDGMCRLIEGNPFDALSLGSRFGFMIIGCLRDRSHKDCGGRSELEPSG